MCERGKLGDGARCCGRARGRSREDTAVGVCRYLAFLEQGERNGVNKVKKEAGLSSNRGA